MFSVMLELDEVEAHDVTAHRFDLSDAAGATCTTTAPFEPARLGAAGLEVAGVHDPGLLGTGAAREGSSGVVPRAQ